MRFSRGGAPVRLELGIGLAYEATALRGPRARPRTLLLAREAHAGGKGARQVLRAVLFSSQRNHRGGEVRNFGRPFEGIERFGLG